MLSMFSDHIEVVGHKQEKIWKIFKYLENKQTDL